MLHVESPCGFGGFTGFLLSQERRTRLLLNFPLSILNELCATVTLSVRCLHTPQISRASNLSNWRRFRMKSSFTIINTNKLKLSGLLALLLATSVMLTACGGGGGGTASMPTTPPTIPAPPTVVVPTTPPTIPAPPMVVVPTTPPAKTGPANGCCANYTTGKTSPANGCCANYTTTNSHTSAGNRNIVRIPTGINDPYFRSTCVPGAMGVGCYTDSNHNLANVVDAGRSI